MLHAGGGGAACSVSRHRVVEGHAGPSFWHCTLTHAEPPLLPSYPQLAASTWCLGSGSPRCGPALPRPAARPCPAQRWPALPRPTPPRAASPCPALPCAACGALAQLVCAPQLAVKHLARAPACASARPAHRRPRPSLHSPRLPNRPPLPLAVGARLLPAVRAAHGARADGRV